MERIGETWKRKSKMIVTLVEGLDKRWLVFFEKNLNKIANLDQKTCKNKTMKGKLGNDSITSSLYKINKPKSVKSGNPSPCNNSRLRSWLCCCKDSKVVYFKGVNCVRFCFRDCTEFFSFVHKKTFKFCSTFLAKYCK